MGADTNYPLLSTIDSPADLRRLPERALRNVAQELRRYLVESVSRSGGHFAAGLGAVELTIALHYLYDTPRDRIVWDVGHQSYPHKILTGRRDRMHSVRKWKGLSPFPKREESPYDTFGVGHAGTSISAAAGMAIAAGRTGSGGRVVAVIGDGGLTCGMAFEALNHAGGAGADLLVVLNDNEMSISPNVGALTNRFAQLLSSRLYTTVRESGKKVLGRVPPVREIARRAEEHVKGLIVPGTLFEEFGFNYVGPIDGHDLNALLPTLANLRRARRPAAAPCRDPQGQGLCARGVRSREVPRHRLPLRSGGRNRAGGRGGAADLLPGLRGLALRHGGARRTARRDHPRDARRVEDGALLGALPRALLRRGHRRAAQRHLRRGARL